MSSRVHTANILALVGAIFSMILGIVYISFLILTFAIPYVPAFGHFMGILYAIVGIISMIGAFLTLFMARKKLLAGDLKTGAIMCLIFGSISLLAIGGIFIIVAGILAIIASSEQRKVAETQSLPPPPPPP